MNKPVPAPPPMLNPAQNVPTVVTSPLAGFNAGPSAPVHAPPIAIAHAVGVSDTDLRYLESMLRVVPAYDKEVSGRYPLFNVNVLRDTVSSGTYSGLLHRAILTFFDAVDHDMAVARMWAAEDESLKPLILDKEQARKEANRRAQRNYREKVQKAPEVEKARAAWRAAVAQKKEALEAWDQHIRVLHDAFREARQAAGVED